MTKVLEALDNFPLVSSYEISKIETECQVHKLPGLLIEGYPEGVSTKEDAEFSVELSFGYARQVSSHAGDIEIEPNTLDISWFGATKGKHLGSLALLMGLLAGKEKSMSVARMSAVSPGAVGAIERLRRLNYVRASLYQIKRGPQLHPQDASADFAKSDNLINSLIAIDYLSEVKRESNELNKLNQDITPAQGHVDCIVAF